VNKIDEILNDATHNPFLTTKAKAQLLAELEKCMPEFSPKDNAAQYLAVVHCHRNIRRLFEEDSDV
jgi:hypothetical protein